VLYSTAKLGTQNVDTYNVDVNWVSSRNDMDDICNCDVYRSADVLLPAFSNKLSFANTGFYRRMCACVLHVSYSDVHLR